jgi:hypothetical protein
MHTVYFIAWTKISDFSRVLTAFVFSCEGWNCVNLNEQWYETRNLERQAAFAAWIADLHAEFERELEPWGFESGTAVGLAAPPHHDERATSRESTILPSKGMRAPYDSISIERSVEGGSEIATREGPGNEHNEVSDWRQRSSRGCEG